MNRNWRRPVDVLGVVRVNPFLISLRGHSRGSAKARTDVFRSKILRFVVLRTTVLKRWPLIFAECVFALRENDKTLAVPRLNFFPSEVAQILDPPQLQNVQMLTANLS